MYVTTAIKGWVQDTSFERCLCHAGTTPEVTIWTFLNDNGLSKQPTEILLFMCA